MCQVDEELEKLISRIKLHEGDTEFWRRRFLGEDVINSHSKLSENDSELSDILVDAESVEVADKEVDDEEGDDADEADEEEEEAGVEVEVEIEAEQAETQAENRIKIKDGDTSKPPQMIGVQLLKDIDTSTRSKKSRRKISKLSMEVSILCLRYCMI